MAGALLKIRVFIGLAALVLPMQACITDEFRFKDMTMDEEWEIGITTPLFSGDLEFRDFIHDWKTPVPALPGPKVLLDFSDKHDILIPSAIIFDSSGIVDSIAFHIKGKYQFTSADLIFTVKNGSPFPLNLELFFFASNEWPAIGPSVLPKPFIESNFSKFPVDPVTTIDAVTLTQSQIDKLANVNRFRMQAWFNKNDFILNNDTLSAHYPISVSIVLAGKVKTKLND